MKTLKTTLLATVISMTMLACADSTQITSKTTGQDNSDQYKFNSMDGMMASVEPTVDDPTSCGGIDAEIESLRNRIKNLQEEISKEQAQLARNVKALAETVQGLEELNAQLNANPKPTGRAKELLEYKIELLDGSLFFYKEQIKLNKQIILLKETSISFLEDQIEELLKSQANQECDEDEGVNSPMETSAPGFGF